jgi:competence ComEA-like helix-hairpin-helix protein
MFKYFLKEWFSFSKGERKGLLFLSLLLIILFVTPFFLRLINPSTVEGYSDLKTMVSASQPQSVHTTFNAANRFEFDPNIVSKDSLILLGLSFKQVEGIMKYREKGGEFIRAEDFFRLSVMSEEQKKSILDLIRIPNKQSIVEIVELNTADLKQLCHLPGIGDKTASFIVLYREALGGFVCAEQLMEVRNIGESKFRMLEDRIVVDTVQTVKIRLTSEYEERLNRHPYVGKSKTKEILDYAEHIGHEPHLKELMNESILSIDDIEKLSPYLVK